MGKENIVAMIPLKDGHALDWRVLRGLSSQTIPLDVMAVSRPKSPRLKKIPEGFLSMSECRNIIKREVLEQYSSPYFLMMNRDVVLVNPTDIEDMKIFLDKNDDFDAVAINTRPNDYKLILDTYHTDIALMLIRRYALSKITFNNDLGCNCRCVCNSIALMNKKVGYLDSRKCLEIE